MAVGIDTPPMPTVTLPLVMQGFDGPSTQPKVKPVIVWQGGHIAATHSAARRFGVGKVVRFNAPLARAESAATVRAAKSGFAAGDFVNVHQVAVGIEAIREPAHQLALRVGHREGLPDQPL